MFKITCKKCGNVVPISDELFTEQNVKIALKDDFNNERLLAKDKKIYDKKICNFCHCTDFTIYMKELE